MYHSWKVLLQLRESAVAWWNGHLKTHPRWFEWATHISADLSKAMFTRLLCSTISKLFPIVTTLPVEIHLQKQFNFFQMNAPSHNDYLWNCCLYCFPLCNIVSRQDWGISHRVGGSRELCPRTAWNPSSTWHSVLKSKSIPTFCF